ncbi:ribokinase [Paenarthrobacter nicotinovorans]|uniref:ribokinase n=1 Tax=Paenarthrobacter nicotinovorans TaxID=29320 RepID=UPI00278829A7|nr:ribokinase [Paenarthrobacter nicotinovorans]MDP9933745.1 ribokinase [Paenarthrobacter nicotinovorans]
MKQDMSGAGRVFIFGSANHDHVLRVAEFPEAGETVMSRSYTSGFGGKGANQAVASAAAGAPVTFVGSVGLDEVGQQMIANFESHGIGTRFVSRSNEPTGFAVVLVDETGSNQIVVAPGANAVLMEESVQAALEAVEPDDVVVVQCEIPVTHIEQVVRGGTRAGATVIANLAPYTEISSGILDDIGVLIVNESEARSLLKSEVSSADLASELVGATGCACIVTLGELGSIYAAPGEGTTRVAASHVERVVDTTGAGDVFVGTFAAAIARRDDTITAMKAATAAAAIAVSTPGAQAPRSQAATLTVG